VGILYNYVVQRKVVFYQSGFTYSIDNRVKPGLVMHTEAIITTWAGPSTSTTFWPVIPSTSDLLGQC